MNLESYILNGGVLSAYFQELQVIFSPLGIFHLFSVALVQ